MVSKWKMWWAWQDREHEEWLAQQSRQGLHLRSVWLLGLLHRFERGAPAEYAYRWDYQCTIFANAEYKQLFEDAGWELAGSIPGGWICWRKAAGAGPLPEIHTDRSSLRNKYRTLLATFAVPALCFAPSYLLDIGRWEKIAAGGPRGALLTVGLVTNAMLVYGAMRIWKRMRTL